MKSMESKQEWGRNSNRAKLVVGLSTVVIRPEGPAVFGRGRQPPVPIPPSAKALKGRQNPVFLPMPDGVTIIRRKRIPPIFELCFVILHFNVCFLI